MATRARKAPPKRQPPKRSDYEETPDWGTLFQREDGPPRPGFTGQGVLSEDSINEILEAGGEFRISLWTLDRDGKPLRNRDGTRRFRVHIEPPYDGDTATAADDDFESTDDGGSPEDIPF